MGQFTQKFITSAIGLFIVVTLGWINAIYHYIIINSLFGWKCSRKQHELKVKAVQKQVKNWADGDRKLKLCSARPGWKSISVNKVDKSIYHQVELGNLTDIVEIDEKNQTITIETGMCMGRLTKIIVPKGWTIPIVPELDSLTVGGLIAGAGLESSSHKEGLFATTALAYEIVLPSGEVVNCTEENDPDLFNAIPGSYGTLGFITAVTLRLIPAKKFVKLEYRFTSSIESALKLINEEAQFHNFVEAFAFSKSKFVIMFGNMTNEPLPPGKINYINRWHKKFFYLQAENIMKKLIKTGKEASNFTEYIPLIDYYHRHTRGCFWITNNAIPLLYNSQLYMTLFGWVHPCNIYIQRVFPQWMKDIVIADNVIQDYVVPLDKTAEVFAKGDELFNIYPVWICPLMAKTNYTCFKIPDKYDNFLYIDLGFYGAPKKASGYDKKCLLRIFEELMLKFGGYHGLYADCFLSREEFETMFDLTNYNKLRKERKIDEAFPEIYDKICAKARCLEK